MADANMTFRQAYGVLQQHAETLRNQTEPNIDDLLPMVEESVAAYRVCKERIDAVEKALEKALTDVATDAALGAVRKKARRALHLLRVLQGPPRLRLQPRAASTTWKTTSRSDGN
jgi:exodeoxyribonuclease VII small subunit